MSRGPIPNRTDDLARPRERKGGDQTPVSKGVARPTSQPEPDPSWLPPILMMWQSLGNSGMSDFYQDSDWAYAWLLMIEINAYLSPVPVRIKNASGEYEDKIDPKTGEVIMRPHKVSGMTFAALMSGLTGLGMTEGDRRRMRIELEEPAPEETPASVTAIEDARTRLSGPAARR